MWNALMHIEWPEMLIPTHSIAEMVVRGTIMYLGLFTILRLVLKRQAGGSSITDILVIVLIADAAQNGMAKEYQSIPEGLVLVLTIILWSFILDWLAFRFAWFSKLIQPQPLLLVHNGKAQRHNMRRELISMEELLGELRQQGVDSIEDVETANMEGDGRISVVKFEKA
jgi:uncharacterized membrane protein YcaP (DUF421 family)